jgi:hypothetical protein
LDEALKDLEMGAGNIFLSLRGSLLDAQGEVRKDIFKPRGDIHLNTAGTQIVSLRIRQVLEIMLPGSAPVQAPAPVQTPPAPVQTLPAIVQAPAVAKRQRTRVQAPVPDTAPVVVNPTPVVGAPLVAEVVNVPDVIQASVVETPMEVEDEDTLLERLFFKRFGRALPKADEKEKEKENDVDKINFVIDLTDEKDEEMEVATSNVAAVVKTEPIEIVNVNNVNNVINAVKVAVDRKERRELVKARKALIAFGKTLRKTKVIPEKEAPEVSADSNVSADASVATVEQTIAESEAAITETNAAIAANQKEFEAAFGDTPLDEFDGTGSEFRLYGPEDVIPSDDEDAMIDDV